MSTFGDRLKKIRKEKKLRQKDLAQVLGVAQTTVANYEKNMRFPDQHILNRMARDLNVSLDYLLAVKEEKNRSIPGVKDNKISLPLISQQYLDALLRQDKEGARKIIDQVVSYDVPMVDIYMNVLEPALIEVGRLWSSNDIGIAQEHFSSFVTQQIMAQINNSKPSLRTHQAVAVTVNGDFHEIGLKMVADLLESDGWEIYYLGINTPTQSIIEAIELTEADILILSVTLPYHMDAAQNLLKVIRSSKGCKKVKVLVGGQAFKKDPSLWKTIGADGYASNGKEAVGVANELVKKI